jgi:hypothetical protein
MVLAPRPTSVGRKRPLALAAVLATSAALVLVPAILLWPFRAQSPERVATAYLLRRVNPVLTLVLLAIGAMFVVSLWRAKASRRVRAGTIAALALLAGLAFLSRQNHFEWMFRPLPQPRFVEAFRAEHVDPCDMVLVVEIGGEARAYPVRVMALHHVVNDVVAGEPIAATY